MANTELQLQLQGNAILAVLRMIGEYPAHEIGVFILRACTTVIKIKIFMLADWRPSTRKSNEIGCDEVFAEHGPRFPVPG